MDPAILGVLEGVADGLDQRGAFDRVRKANIRLLSWMSAVCQVLPVSVGKASTPSSSSLGLDLRIGFEGAFRRFRRPGQRISIARIGTMVEKFNVILDDQRIELSVFDDHLNFRSAKSTGARFWVTPIRTQLALSTLAKDQPADMLRVNLAAIRDLSVYEANGQVNLLVEGASDWFYFLVLPSKKGQAVFERIEPLWTAARSRRAALG